MRMKYLSIDRYSFFPKFTYDFFQSGSTDQSKLKILGTCTSGVYCGHGEFTGYYWVFQFYPK